MMMAVKPGRTRLVMELGMGTDITGSDYTKAACRAVFNALRQNSLALAPAFGKSRDDMHCEIVIGVQRPDEVRAEEVAAILPYGSREVRVEKGGLDTLREGPDGEHEGFTILANAAILVHLDLTQADLDRIGVDGSFGR
ncbi:MAG: Lin0512 family protein [Pseudomonadota bacterium]